MSKVKSRRIFVVGGDIGYSNWMEATGIVASLDEADLVVFTGGEDVSPHLYNKQKHPLTSNNPARDEREQIMFKQAVGMGKPMVGICRGAQFLCVMSGGELIQHQDNNNFIHPIHTDKLNPDEVIYITSTHHQAMYPWMVKNWNLLGWTKDMLTYHYGENVNDELVRIDGKGKYVAPARGREVEVAHFADSNCLCIQGHPEMMWGMRDQDEDIAMSIAWLQMTLDLHMEHQIKPNMSP